MQKLTARDVASLLLPPADQTVSLELIDQFRLYLLWGRRSAARDLALRYEPDLVALGEDESSAEVIG